MGALRASLAVIALVLTACASPRLINPDRPSADLRADAAICDREAERVAKRELLSSYSEVNKDCLTCIVTPARQDMRAASFAKLAYERCLAAKGWRAAS